MITEAELVDLENWMETIREVYGYVIDDGRLRVTLTRMISTIRQLNKEVWSQASCDHRECDYRSVCAANRPSCEA